MTTMTDHLHCDRCGGTMPPEPIWEVTRDRAGDCTGSVDPSTGRCRAFVEDALWLDGEADED